MSAHTLRTFEVPEALIASGYGPTADLDMLDREVEFPGEFGEWAEKVLFTENTKILEDVCGGMRLLPRGILASVQLDDDSVLVSGLVSSDGRVWDSRFNAWVASPDGFYDENDTIILDDDEVAFVARALREGADEVWFRPYIPKAFVSAVVAAPEAPTSESDPAAKEVPAGSAIVAVVDPIDEDAVLEMLAITPGPHVLRRHNGNWFEDPEWVQVLKSVKPPKIVKLDEAQVASVSAQVDRSTLDQDWEPFDADTREQYQIFTASAGAFDDVEGTEDDAEEREMFSLVAVAGRELTPKDIANTERLKRYWTIGRGAAKIRWGTPGAWTRCHRNLRKYMRSDIAAGYCTNLSQRLGGPGIATHVTSAAEPFDIDTYEQAAVAASTVAQSSGTSEAIKRSPYLQELQNEADERALFALVAVAGRELTPKDVASTERLKRYWTVGRGAAKIRWGTPGAWRRCYRHLVKYVGPKVAPGYCTNLSQRLGGPGIATHVGTKAKHRLTSSADDFEDVSVDDIEDVNAVTAANPSGINQYDKGMSFEEATGGVVRDYHGRFAPEGGSNRSARAQRRRASMARRKKARDEKAAKKAGTSTADKERNKAEREELAAIALQIAQLRADGKDLEAAELRVRYAELAVQYADTPTQKLNAQAALVNAKDALQEKKYAIERQRRREQEREAEARRRSNERRSREESRTRQAQEDLDRSLGL